MIERAMKQRWPVSDQFKGAAMNRLGKILANPDSSERAVVAATRALIAMESQNQQDEHKVIDGIEFGNDRLAAIAADLGIDPALIVDGTATPTGRAATDAEDTCNNGA